MGSPSVNQNYKVFIVLIDLFMCPIVVHCTGIPRDDNVSYCVKLFFLLYTDSLIVCCGFVVSYFSSLDQIVGPFLCSYSQWSVTQQWTGSVQTTGEVYVRQCCLS